MSTGPALKRKVKETAVIGAFAQLRIVLESDPDVTEVKFSDSIEGETPNYALVHVRTQSEGLRTFEIKISEPR